MALDCCLVLMPYADLRAPSLGLGLLQAALRQEGLAARVIHANLDFAEVTGLAMQEQVMKAGRWLLGEWSFARAAFPEHARRDQEYLDFLYQRWVMRYPPRARRIKRTYFHERALGLREQAEAFLDDLAERLLDLEPRVVGCSSTFQQHVASLALLRRLREKDPRVISLLGGANCEGAMGLATHRAFPWVDYLVSGEADRIIAPLLRGLLEQGRDLPPEDLPAGVWAPAHRQAGYPQAGPGQDLPRAVLADLDQAPLPDYGDFFARLEQSPALKAAIEAALPFETSRGCWWAQQPGGGCTFCGLNGMEAGQRRKSPALALEQVRGLMASYPARKVRMSDNMLPPDYYKTFLPGLAQAPWRGAATFFYETRSGLSRGQVAALRQAGVIWIQPGVESLDSRCLALINKGCQAWQHVQTLKWCLHQGVRATWHLLFGFPGEQDAWHHDMAGLLPLLHHLQSPTMLMPFNYDRFSTYQGQPERYGLELTPIADYAHVYPLPPAELHDLAYLWQDPAQEAYALNPLAPYLGHGGGLEALEKAFLAWRRAFLVDNPRAQLCMRDTPAGLEITDTRAGGRDWRLTGLERDLCLACDEAPKREALWEALARAGHGRPAVLEALERLLAGRLLVELDGRVLALAVAEPLHPYPELTDHPAGGLRFGGEANS